MKWVTAATAPNQVMAEVWRNLLAEEGVPAVVRAGDTASFLGVSTYPCRVLVPEGRQEEAAAILASEGEP